MEQQQHIDLKDRTKTFALQVIGLTKNLNSNLAEREIARQLIRSGMSVGANTRAAFKGRSKKEFVAKVGIVIEEADECSYWLELLEVLLDDKKEEIKSLNREAQELTSIFVSISKKNKKDNE